MLGLVSKMTTVYIASIKTHLGCKLIRKQAFSNKEDAWRYLRTQLVHLGVNQRNALFIGYWADKFLPEIKLLVPGVHYEYVTHVNNLRCEELQVGEEKLAKIQNFLFDKMKDELDVTGSVSLCSVKMRIEGFVVN